MFRNMKLGTRLILSFLGIALITLLLGVLGFYGTNQSEEHIDEIGGVLLPSVDSMLEISRNAERIAGVMRTLAIPGLPKEIRERQYDNMASAREDYQKVWKIYESLPQTPEEAQVWKQFVLSWEAWRVENNKALEFCRKFDEIGVENPYLLKRDIEQFRGDHYLLEVNVMRMMADSKTFDGGDDHTGCAFGHWMAALNTDCAELKQHIHACRTPHQQFHDCVGKIKRHLAAGQTQAAQDVLEREMKPAAAKVFAHFQDIRTLSDEAIDSLDEAQAQIIGPVTARKNDAMALLNQIVQINRNQSEHEVEKAHSEAAFMKVFSLAAMIVGVTAAIALGLLITRSITKPIRRIITDLTEGSDQVSSASGQVSSASQSLAEGATEQAAGLEQTSSSLEEMSSMTKQNADNAQQANRLASEARKAAEGGAESMDRMSRAIDDIQKSSNETAKIVKVIDEIAFQTNLLALNAAVEAARAGEAGKGFAVVAAEVRNLAMRSAEAAKNTAEMIDGSVRNAKNGVEISREVSKALQEIVGSIAKTTDLVGEIAAASREQAQGIDQVNTAVAQMEEVTQSNAANAEESASASEELSAQAEQMKGIVDELVGLVEGAAARRLAGGSRT